MLARAGSVAALVFTDQMKKYFKAHPRLAIALKRAEKTYGTFDQYLRLTQPRLVLQETEGGSNAEATISVEVSRVNR
jgi:hypothetical protein